MLDFAITGLGRCRTAWFSAFLSDARCHCWHEYVRHCYGPEDFERARVPGKISGVADTMIWTCDPIPARRVLVIHRDIEAVASFQERVLGVRTDWLPHQERLSRVQGWHVAFDDLDQKMPEIVRYLTGFDMDYGRYTLFRELRIEVSDPCGYDAPDYWRDALCQ